MIKQINNAGGYNGQLIKFGDFTDAELESILEFGDHRCFPETKYVQSTGYYYDKNGHNQRTHYSLPDKASRTFNDINISKKLGGYRMRKSILRTIDSKETKLNKKRAYIKQVLSTLPEKFKVIGDIIKTDDLAKLAEFSSDIYKNRMFRYIVMLVIIRAEENGLVFSEDELFNHFDMKRKGTVKMKSDLTQAGFRSKIVRDKKIENALIEANNLLFELKETKFLDTRQMKMVRSIINTFPDKFPRLFHARSSLGLPMIFMSLYIINWDENLTIGNVVREYSDRFNLSKDEYYTLYQSTKRACKRADQLDRVELDLNQFISIKSLNNPQMGSNSRINNQIVINSGEQVNNQMNKSPPPEELLSDNSVISQDIVDNCVDQEYTVDTNEDDVHISGSINPVSDEFDFSKSEPYSSTLYMISDTPNNISSMISTQSADIMNYQIKYYIQSNRQEEPSWIQDIHYPERPPPWYISNNFFIKGINRLINLKYNNSINEHKYRRGQRGI